MPSGFPGLGCLKSLLTPMEVIHATSVGATETFRAQGRASDRRHMFADLASKSPEKGCSSCTWHVARRTSHVTRGALPQSNAPLNRLNQLRRVKSNALLEDRVDLPNISNVL
jgi:hypothetical protein